MAATETTGPTVTVVPEAPGRRNVLGSWWAISLLIIAMLLALGGKFLTDPSLSAPTRDPAWYTWRAQVVMDADPASVVAEWGPNGLFSGGYRVSTLVAGAMLERVVGIDRYSFSWFMMVGIPILAG